MSFEQRPQSISIRYNISVKHLVGDVWNVQFLHRIAGKKKENAAPLPRRLSHANVLLKLLNLYPFNYDYP